MIDTSPTVISGQMLAGKYRVDRLLGEGGMGVVLAATNEALRQRVAIKLLRSGALANAKALGRFEREARAAASLRSEHVARVLDVGKLEDGRPYMVMEYLEGRDLGDVVEQDMPLPVGDAVDYVLQACEAIAEAHAAGIIHRDLKPKNLFLSLTVDGRPLVKVLDFGISKMDDAAEDMSLTRTTEIIGSPSYMSPEQLRASKAVDVRTDIWSLGVILYELLTGKLPFQAVTVTELVAVVLTDPAPDTRADRPDVPQELAEAIQRCLAKRRDDRFASVTDLVRAIAPFGRSDISAVINDRVDRVARVAAGSGRSLPPSPTGSGPYALPPEAMAGGATVPIAAVAPAPAGPSGPPRASASAPARPDPSGFPEAGGDAPPTASSARLAIHGGTSVAWGETQVDAAGPVHPRRSRWPLFAAAASLIVLLGGAGTGAVVYVKRANATPTAPTAPPPPPSLTLPDGRKDLPPLATAEATTTATAPVEAPTSLPATRVPTSEGKPHVAAKKRPVTGSGVVTTAAGGQGRTPAAPAAPPAPAVQQPADDLSNIGRR
jgi:serine/threonine protein kinase